MCNENIYYNSEEELYAHVRTNHVVTDTSGKDKDPFIQATSASHSRKYTNLCFSAQNAPIAYTFG